MERSAERAFDGVIFDFFGVLTFNMVEVITAFEDREGLPRGVFLEAWASARGQDLFHRVELGQISQTEWNRSYADLIGVRPDNLMGRYLHDAFPAYQVLKAARRLRAAGVRTAVLSNSLGREPYDPYAGFDLWGTFDEVVLSADHGVRKPDPEIFRLALARLGVPAERCLFIDDSEENLAAAHKLGITPLLGLDEDVTAKRLHTTFALPVL
ncbi:HAD-IA family hydrolase [Streptomyces sodiiphilus]|uniref:HAD-IA family hydrolase n=1 Tax=Streptomyces sodiiphilus TaxID=226217 RepID=A0ABN2NSS6_9ACTN